MHENLVAGPECISELAKFPGKFNGPHTELIDLCLSLGSCFRGSAPRLSLAHVENSARTRTVRSHAAAAVNLSQHNFRSFLAKIIMNADMLVDWTDSQSVDGDPIAPNLMTKLMMVDRQGDWCGDVPPRRFLLYFVRFLSSFDS